MVRRRHAYIGGGAAILIGLLGEDLIPRCFSRNFCGKLSFNKKVLFNQIYTCGRRRPSKRLYNTFLWLRLYKIQKGTPLQIWYIIFIFFM